MLRMFFFFSSRRRHTRCYRDWSSDVCSSDLGLEDHLRLRQLVQAERTLELAEHASDEGLDRDVGLVGRRPRAEAATEIDRERKPAGLGPRLRREGGEP